MIDLNDEERGAGLTRVGLQAALSAPAVVGSLDAMFAPAPPAAENPLRELMSAERVLANFQATQPQRPVRRRHGFRVITDGAERILREKRRQKAKQAARRLKAVRS